MKNKLLIFTRVLYVLLAIGTLGALFIAYKGIGGSFAFNFLKGYTVLIFFSFIYIPIVTILNLRKFKSAEIKKYLTKAVLLFISFGLLNFILDWIFRPSKVDLLREFSVAFGMAFGIAFVDATFLKRKKYLE